MDNRSIRKASIVTRKSTKQITMVHFWRADCSSPSFRRRECTPATFARALRLAESLSCTIRVTA